MNAWRFAVFAGWLASACAQAQSPSPAVPSGSPGDDPFHGVTAPAVVESPAPLVLVRPAALAATPAVLAPFAAIGPAPRTYMRNDADPVYHAAPLDLMGRFVTDPKLVAGVRLTPLLGVEIGYASLVDRGTVFVDYRRADGTTGRQGTTGFSSYLAGTATLPLDRGLEAYGKLGVSFSEFKHHELGPVPRPGSFRETDTGAYATAGAS